MRDWLRYHWQQSEKWPFTYGVPAIIVALLLGAVIGTILEWWLK